MYEMRAITRKVGSNGNREIKATATATMGREEEKKNTRRNKKYPNREQNKYQTANNRNYISRT